MRTSLIPIVLLAICIIGSPAFGLAQQPTTSQNSSDQNDQLCTIAGTVLSANTGEPLKKAHVVLAQKDAEGDDSNKQPLGATTDAAGHFSIEKIPPGSYELVVIRTDYQTSRYGQDQPDKPGATLSLAPGQKMTDLLFRLNRMAIITGRVRDEDGEPIRGAHVVTLIHTTVHGKPETFPNQSDRTNDLGEYRIVDLRPGRYSIQASAPHSAYPGERFDNADTYLPTYYSGTPDSARASTIEVKSGDEISGIDFVLAPKPPTRAYKVRGHVLNSLTDPDANIMVVLFPRGDRDPTFSSDQKRAIADQKTGNFEIKDVVSGEYVAAAVWYAGSGTRAATQNVDVIASDVDGVSLVLTNGIDITGRIIFEGKSAVSATDITVQFMPAENETHFRFGGERHAKVNSDGSFLLKGVGDGTYSINVYSKCRECYVKSATANGVDLLEQGFQIASGGGPGIIAIVYSSNTGTLNGAVTKKDDLPATGALVVLVPDAGSHQKPEEYKTSTTDQYGHFEIRGVPPGHYKAFAWEKVSADSYSDPDFLKPLEGMAESLDISANEQKSVQLKMIPAADSAN